MFKLGDHLQDLSAIVGIEGSGKVVGSVSGGCLEDDLISKNKGGPLIDKPSFVSYGVTKEEAKMFGLPCGEYSNFY